MTSRIKHAIDASFSTAWIERVGKLILNFSVLEVETYLWLVQMSEEPDRIAEFTKKKFSARVEKIKIFVHKRAYTDDWKSDSLEGWGQAVGHAEIRNRIAHNPLTFGWTKGVEVGEPDFIGLVDLQRRDAKQGALVTKREMDQVINAIVSLASRLASLREEWCTTRDEKHMPKCDN